MTLTFLGRKYEAAPTETAAVPTGMTGKYRGVPMAFGRSPLAQANGQQLSYRGVSYLK